MIAPLAPTLPPLGAGAHCDALVLPKTGNFTTIAYRKCVAIAIGDAIAAGAEPPGAS